MKNYLETISADQIDFDKLTKTQLEFLKSRFNYKNPKSAAQLEFAEVYNKYRVKRQMSFIVNSRLQIKLIPLKADLSLDFEKAKYLHTSQVQSLNLDFENYGFSGELQFNIPYDTEEESLWDDLFNHDNKFAVEIVYQEDKLENSEYLPNKDNCWSIRAYIDLNQANALELNDQINDYGNNLDSIHYLSCKLVLCDAFAFFAKQHYPVQVFAQTTYKKLFDKVFKNFDSLLKFEIDDAIKLFDTKYNWICLNSNSPERIFYDYFFATLKHYQLQLVYDYDKLDPNYTIVDLSNSKASEKPTTITPGIIQHIQKTIGQSSLANINLINHHWVNKDKSELVAIKNAVDKVTMSQDYIYSYPVAAQFKSAQGHYKARNENDIKLKDQLNIDWNYFPNESNVLPNKLFAFADKYLKTYIEHDKEFCINSSSIAFNNYKNISIYAGQTSVLTVTSKAKDIEDRDYALDHGIQISSKIYPIDKVALSYPDFIQEIMPLKLYAWIDDLNDQGTDNIYFITSGDKPGSKDVSSDYEAPEGTSCFMHHHSAKELSYVVKLPPNLNANEAKPFFITLPFFILNDHEFISLRKGTAVEISLNQEHGCIDRVMWHSLQDKLFSKDSQINKLTLGANDCAGIIHQAETNKIKESSLEIFAENSKNKTQIISDKTQMSFVYTEDKK